MSIMSIEIGEYFPTMNRTTFYLTLTSLLIALTVSSPAQSARKKAQRAASDSDRRIEELKGLVIAQQQQIEQQRAQVDLLKTQVRQLIDTTQQANAIAQKAQAATEQAQTAATQAQQTADMAEQKATQATSNAEAAKTAVTATQTASKQEEKRLAAVENFVGRFRLIGDIRVRGDGIFQSYPGCNATSAGRICADRNRVRLRVRFGMEGKLNEDFVGGFAIATGSLADPTTTNEDLTNFFDRKTIGLERGYITYKPVAHKWLALTGGKFTYPWLRTSLTMDPDITPEGFSEKLSWDFESTPLKNFTVQGMQLLFTENRNAALFNAGDSFAVGGQVSATVKLGPLTVSPYVTVLNWRNTDSILNASGFAVGATTAGSTGTNPVGPVQVPGEGPGCSPGSALPAFPPCAIASNRLTNSTFTGADGKPHFASHFLYGDFILNNQVKTPWQRLPFNLVLEAHQNLRAAGHPLDAKGKVRTDLGRQSHAYMVDASLGQSKNKGDVQVGYSWWRTEQDAIIATWAESEQRAPSNILQSRIYALWKLSPNTVAGYSLWIGRTLNPNLQHAVLAPGWTTALGSTEPNLKRQQFDLMYSF
jgi:hypothetical protein